MREYARLQTSILLRRFAFQVNRVTKSTDADGIHDLRVSIRRLSRCLRVFADLYPDKTWKRLRSRMRELMTACGAVRDFDIALELLEEAGTPDPGLAETLQKQRRKAAHKLTLELRGWKRKDFSQQWRRRLEL